MIEEISVTSDAGQDVYAALVRTDDRLDFADMVFKAETADEAIADVNTGLAGAASFEVAGDITADLVVGQKIRVSGSTGNDGVYTIRSGSAYSAPNTTINVVEAVSDATVDGDLNLTATPYLALTEQPISADHSRYYGEIDLADVAPGMPLIAGALYFYNQVGASPVPDDDDYLNHAGFEAQLGKPGRREFSVKHGVALVTTSGTSLQAFAELLADGQRVPLKDLDPAATCELDVWVHGPPAAPLISLSTSDMGAVNDDHRFAGSKVNPNPTADSLHHVTARIILSDPALGELGVIEGQSELESDSLFYAAP